MQMVIDQVQSAMQLDVLESSWPLTNWMLRPDDIVDDISSQKGTNVLITSERSN